MPCASPCDRACLRACALVLACIGECVCVSIFFPFCFLLLFFPVAFCFVGLFLLFCWFVSRFSPKLWAADVTLQNKRYMIVSSLVIRSLGKLGAGTKAVRHCVFRGSEGNKLQFFVCLISLSTFILF